MPENTRSYGLMMILVGVAVLVGAAGGVLAARELARTRPTCTNAVNSYFDVMPERQRYLFDNHDGGRGRYVRSCREGRWSKPMKSCWVDATSTSDIDACPNEWLNATTICEQMKREALGLARRCHIDSGKLDCDPVRGFGPGIKDCIEAMRDADCSEVEQAKESCKGVLSGPN